MKKDYYISIHNSAPTDEWACYRKGKKYTYEEYSKSVYRKQLIKDIALMAALGVVMVFRAYVFFEYGV